MTLVSTRKRLHVEDVARCRVLSLSAEIHRELEATFDDVVRKFLLKVKYRRLALLKKSSEIPAATRGEIPSWECRRTYRKPLTIAISRTSTERREQTMKVFWSWQSDTPTTLNRDFVKAALEDALATVSVDLGLSEAERPEIDHDTKGEAGLVSIVDTIFRKIKEAEIFVGDVSYVGETPKGKRLPNPNVMIELGHALTSIGPERIVLVANRAFGGRPEDLPFDLRHRRGPIIYELRDVATRKERDAALKQLTKDLVGALSVNLGIAFAQRDSEVTVALHPALPDDRSTWLAKGEKIRHHDFFNDGGERVWAVTEGTRAYMRVAPAAWDNVPSRREVQTVGYDGHRLQPMGPWRDGDGGANDFGVVAVALTPQRPGEIFAVTQWFVDTGEVWGFNSAAAFERNGKSLIAAPSILKEWAGFLKNSLAFLQHFGASPPFKIEAGVTGLKDVYFEVGIASVVPALDSDVSLTRQIRNWDEPERLAFVTDVFNKLLDAFNQPRVTKDQVWQSWHGQK